MSETKREKEPTEKRHRPSITIDALLPGTFAGLVGGLAFGAAMVEHGSLPSIASLVRADSAVVGFVVHIVIAALVGALFGVLVWRQHPEIGETVFWGFLYGGIFWFLGAMTLLPALSGKPVVWTIDAARELLPALVGHLIYGAVMGLVLALSRSKGPRSAAVVHQGAALRGMAAGTTGALLLGWTLDSQLGLPAVSASMIDRSSPLVWFTTLGSGAIAGSVFGGLYPSGTRGSGPALIRGLVFGFVWWVVAALTLLPLAFGDGLRWSFSDMQEGFTTLPGYLLYSGAVMGLIYQWLTSVQTLLFSDRIDESGREGVGTQGLRATSRGAIAGLGGGAVFTIVMLQIGFLDTVSNLIRQDSTVVGLLIHLAISNVIGIGYGLGFARRSNDVSSALGWGISYGVLWWFLGPLTLLPILLGGSAQWTVEAASNAYPALVGHIAYGAFLGFIFHRLEARHNPWWIRRGEAENDRLEAIDRELKRSGPALWGVTISIALTVPLLIGT